HDVGDRGLAALEIGERRLLELAERGACEIEERLVVRAQRFRGERVERVAEARLGVGKERELVAGRAPLALELGGLPRLGLGRGRELRAQPRRAGARLTELALELAESLPPLFEAPADVVAAVWIARRPLLVAIGSMLVVEDALAPVDVIVISSAGVREDSLEAAQLYHDGISRRLVVAKWFDEPLDAELRRIGVQNLDATSLALAILEHSGVPSSAVTVVPGP